MVGKNKENVVDYQWLDNVTFVVGFAATEVSNGNFGYEEVIVEFHADTDEWVCDKQFYDKFGTYVGHDLNDFLEGEKDRYISIAKEKLKEYKKLFGKLK